MDDKDLQEQLERERFKGVYGKIDANYELVNRKIDTNHNEVKSILNQILTQTTKTNGRVTKLEGSCANQKDLDRLAEETQFARTVTFKYPRLAGLAVIGILALSQIENIIKVITKIF